MRGGNEKVRSSFKVGRDFISFDLTYYWLRYFKQAEIKLKIMFYRL